MPDTTEITPADVHRLLQEFMSRNRQTYIGMRYVPVFADPIEWSAETEYEPLTYVKYAGYLYISKGYVPAGVTPLDTTFWVLVSFGESGGGTSDDHTYGTVAQLLADTSLAAGDVCRTLGYYEPLDDGGSTYVVSASDVPDGVARLEMANGLTAVLVYESSMCPVQFGAHPLDPNTSPDTITDDMLSDEAFFYMLSADIAIDGRNRGYGIRYLVTSGNIADVRNCSLFVLAPVNITASQLVNFDNVNTDSSYVSGIGGTYAFTITGNIIRLANSNFKAINRITSGIYINVNYCGCITGCTFSGYSNSVTVRNYINATMVIQNCTALNCSAGFNVQVAKTYINACIFRSCFNNGIIVANVSNAFLSATNCYFEACGNAISGATVLGGSLAYIYISGNYITNCSARNNYAINAIRTREGSTIVNNTLIGCAGSGIMTDASIVAGNRIVNMGTSHPAYTYDYGEGIRIDSMTGNPIEVHGNVISGCWKYGILYVQSDTALANQPKLFIHGNTINGIVNDGDDAYSIYLVNSHSGAGMAKPAVLRGNVSDFPMYNYGQEIDTDCSVPIADATLSPDVVVPSMCDGSLTDMISGIYDATNTPALVDGSVYVTAGSTPAYVNLAHYVFGESVAIRIGINTSYNNFNLYYYRSWDDYNDDNPAILNLTDAATIDFRPQYIVLPPCYGPITLVIPAGQSCQIFELAIMRKFTAWDGAFPPNTHMTNDYTQGT